MKTQIRQGVFETNSSSTHTLCLYDKSEWQRFVNGEMAIEYGCYHPKLLEITDENKDRVFTENSDGNVWDHDYMTYKVWDDIWNYDSEAWESLEEDVADKHVVSFFQYG